MTTLPTRAYPSNLHASAFEQRSQMTPAPITLTARIHPSQAAFVRKLLQETIILNMASEQFFSLDAMGSRIWALLDEHPQLDGVHAALCGEFDADPARIETELLGLVRLLANAGLVEVG